MVVEHEGRGCTHKHLYSGLLRGLRSCGFSFSHRGGFPRKKWLSHLRFCLYYILPSSKYFLHRFTQDQGNTTFNISLRRVTFPITYYTNLVTKWRKKKSHTLWKHQFHGPWEQRPLWSLHMNQSVQSLVTIKLLLNPSPPFTKKKKRRYKQRERQRVRERERGRTVVVWFRPHLVLLPPNWKQINTVQNKETEKEEQRERLNHGVVAAWDKVDPAVFSCSVHLEQK